MCIRDRVWINPMPRTRGTPVYPDNRNQVIGEEREIGTWTVFTFPGRGGQYSSLQWHWWHFVAVDYDEITGSIGGTIYRLQNKQFAAPVSDEFGNYSSATIISCWAPALI